MPLRFGFQVRTLMIVVAAVAVPLAGFLGLRETTDPVWTWWIRAAFLCSPCWITSLLVFIFCQFENDPQ
jgi:hypothetical protein